MGVVMSKANLPEGWKVETLEKIGRVSMCKRVFKKQTSITGDIPFYKIGTFGKEPDAFISNELYEKYCKKFSFPKKGDVLISASGTIGRRVVYDGTPAYFQDSNIVWLDNNESKVLNRFLYYFYEIVRWRTAEGATISRLYNNILKEVTIAVPPLPEQKAIANILQTWDTAIEKTEALIAAKEKQFGWLKYKLITNIERHPDTKITSLGEFLEYEQPTLYIVKSTDYTDDGKTPVLTANQSFVLGYTNENEGIFDKHPVIIFDDFTTDSKYVDFPFKVKSSAMKILSAKNDKINIRYIYAAMSLLKFPLGGHKRYWISEYQFLDIPLPTLENQQKIANSLDTAKKEIDTLKKLVDRYRTQKRGLMQKLLTGKWRVKM